ncbi:hypothetical protein MMC29_005161 [Sticta canariensis]|nr:hypothetical protein [Sticta canariensis]
MKPVSNREKPGRKLKELEHAFVVIGVEMWIHHRGRLEGLIGLVAHLLVPDFRAAKRKEPPSTTSTLTLAAVGWLILDVHWVAVTGIHDVKDGRQPRYVTWLVYVF